MPAIRYRVTLTDEEREALGQRLRRGRAGTRLLTRAPILLKADEVVYMNGPDPEFVPPPRLRRSIDLVALAASLRALPMKRDSIAASSYQTGAPLPQT
jgi:hypothetical protein